MIKNIALIIFILLFNQIQGQAIPANKKVDWTNVGMTKEFVMPTVVVDFKKRGGFTDGLKSNDSLMKMIITERKGLKVIIHFAPGKYLFNQTIRLTSNQVIRGEGAASELIFDLNNSAAHPIQLYGIYTNTISNLLVDAKKGNNYISLTNPLGFKAGDLISVFDKNPLHKSVVGGQFETVEKVEFNKVTLNGKIRKDISASYEGRAIRYAPIVNAGVIDLKIKRVDDSTSNSVNVIVIFGQNCLVKCIESENTNHAHVQLFASANCEVSGNYFHGGFDYVNTDKSMGVLLYYSTSDCIIKNNIFKKLKSGVNIQLGCNGNVVAYNYFLKP